MKLLLMLLLVSALFSCKKESVKTCWDCQYGTTNGETLPDEKICNDGEVPKQRYNSIGSPFNQFCEKL